MMLPRVLFVTGKGGTGKSTVAAAIALALSRRRPTTLADLDRRLSAAAALGAIPNDSTVVKVTESLEVISLTPRAELEAFIERIVPIRAISRRMLRSRTFGYVTAALPGLEAFLLLERLRIMAGDAALEDRYLVIDAPASGSAVELLSVSSGVKGIAPAGTLNRLADSIDSFLADPTRFGAVITTTPEDLAVREAIETAATIRERLGVVTVAAIVNCVPDLLFDTSELAALSPLGGHARLAVRRNCAHERAALGRAAIRRRRSADDQSPDDVHAGHQPRRARKTCPRAGHETARPMKPNAHPKESTRRQPIDLLAKSLVICLGPGGVGKTTISAALAVRAALLGCAVDVMTVDPAPRLLDALGLEADSSEPVEVHLDGIRHGRRRKASSRARLRALRLDPKRTFDSIIARYALSDAARDTILENRIYRNLSGALAGVADYMAMEKLLELAANPDTDLIVLDTPPATEAIDFLDAPRRLLELLNSRAISLLGAPSGLFKSQLRIVDMAARAVLAAFDRVTGLNLLSDVQSFVRSFDGMYEGFSARAARAQDKLRAADTAIVIVTTAESSRIAQAREFVSALEGAGLRVSAMIVNRVLAELPDASELASAHIAPSLKKKLKRNLADYAALKTREEVSLDALRKSIPADAVLMVAPDLGREPRTISDLVEIGGSLRAA